MSHNNVETSPMLPHALLLPQKPSLVADIKPHMTSHSSQVSHFSNWCLNLCTFDEIMLHHLVDHFLAHIAIVEVQNA